MQDCELDTWGSKEPFGSFWLWVAGTAVGNTDATEQLALSFLPLAELVRRSGDRPNARFKGIANVDKFNLVIWIRFGEDHDFDEERWGAHDRETLRREHLRHYEVIPRGYSPYCDGWEAILVEQDATETFIWRRSQGDASEVQECVLPRGLFADVATRALRWFDPLRRERLGADWVGGEEVEPRLVKRTPSL